MTAAEAYRSAASSREEHACAACVRRSLLLASISARLEIRSRLRGRLFELLALDDHELVGAVGESLSVLTRAAAPSVNSACVCRHDEHYPASLADDGAPRLLYVRGGIARLSTLSSRTTVAICGSSRSTDYGIELAHSIACELAGHGVTIVSGLADGVGAAAQRAATAARAGAIAILSGGHAAGVPARRRALAQAVTAHGCVVAELPEDCRGRVWGRIAAARVLARLALVTVVVEADETPVDLSAAHVARARGRQVAVVPGRVTSPASRGAHQLLIEGAHLTRGAADVLALLAPAGALPAPKAAAPAPGLDPALLSVLEMVGAGMDTPEKLEREGASSERVLLALSRLEVLGLLARGDGGRYLACGGGFG